MLQTVKDIVLELVADGDVLSDKIGVTTFYWSFPSEAVNKVALCSLLRIVWEDEDALKYSVDNIAHDFPPHNCI